MPSQLQPTQSTSAIANVLIVEDDDDTAAMLKVALECEGYAVTTTSNRDKATNVLSNVHFSTIVMDYTMPGKSAEAFVREVKRSSPATTFILTTADGQAHERARQLSLPFWIGKPFTTQALINKLNVVASPWRTPRTAHILIAEDNEFLRQLYEQELIDEGYRVSTAENGLQALECVKVCPPDLVVLDVDMPGMDGMKCMHEIWSKHRVIPVILHTGFSKFGNSALTWAANAYVVKSGDLSELKEKIRELLLVFGTRGAATK